MIGAGVSSFLSEVIANLARTSASCFACRLKSRPSEWVRERESTQFPFRRLHSSYVPKRGAMYDSLWRDVINALLTRC